MPIDNLTSLNPNKQNHPEIIPPSDPIYYLSAAEYNKLLSTLQTLIDDYNLNVSALGEGISLPLITSGDSLTEPTDSNIFSAARVLQEIRDVLLGYDDYYLSKRLPDTAEGKIRFNKGIQLGDYQSGFRGGIINENADAELQSLTLRDWLQVPELRFNRIEVYMGDKWRSPGGGIIESVDIQNQIITLKLEPGEYGAVAVGDLCMGIFHSIIDSNNATSDLDDSRNNRAIKGFATSYFKVEELLNPSENNSRFRYSLRPISSRYTRQIQPEPFMHFAAFGNAIDTSRQSSAYETRTYQRFLINMNDWESTQFNVAAQFGDLSNLNALGLTGLSGYSVYLNNVYFTGTIQQMKAPKIMYGTWWTWNGTEWVDSGVPAVIQPQDGIYATLINESSVINRTDTNYSHTWAELHVYEGNTELIYNKLEATTRGTYTVSLTQNNVEVGDLVQTSLNGRTFLRTTPIVGISSGVGSGSILFNIRGIRLDGTAFSFSKNQTFVIVDSGDDAINVILSNEAHVFSTVDGVTISSSTTTDVLVYIGITQVIPTSITVGATPFGMTSSVSGSTITFSVTSGMTSTSGTVPITVVVDGQTITKSFSYSLASKGADGENGKTISVTGTTQVIKVDKYGNRNPSTNFTVVGTPVNTTITSWTYSINGGNFSSTVPTGLSRSGNTVTVNPLSVTANNISIKASDGEVSDVFTVAVIYDGQDGQDGEGTPGEPGEGAIIYSLNPSVPLIKKNSSGVLDYTSIYCSILKSDGSVTTELSSNNTGYSMYYKRNGGSEISYSYKSNITIDQSTYKIEFLLKNGSTVIDRETVLVLTDGKGAVSVNLTNDMVVIKVDQGGNVISGLPATTTFNMYYETTLLTLNNLTVSNITGITTSVDQSTGTVTITNITSSVPDSVDLILTGTANNGSLSYTKSATFHIVKLRDGEMGPPGTGVPVVYRGEYSDSAVYYGSTIRLDIVKYQNYYYRTTDTAGTFSGVPPVPNQDTDHWLRFGASFESVATALLLAEKANIGGFAFDGKTSIISQEGVDQNGTLINLAVFNDPIEEFIPNLKLNGQAGEIYIRDKIKLFGDGSGYLANNNIRWNTTGDLLIGGSIAGKDGNTGLALYTEFSITGKGNWHTYYRSGDIFIRTKVVDDMWSEPMKIIGESSTTPYTEFQFANNTSSTTPPTSDSTEWKDAPVQLSSNGQHMWMRFRTVTPPSTYGAWSTPSRITPETGYSTSGIVSAIKFAADGSGYIANNGISWTTGGDLTVNGQLFTGTPVGGIYPNEIRSDGSGHLANGNISWNIAGNTTFSGTLSGVTGTFKTLECVNNLGNSLGKIKFGSDGNIWFESCGLYHQAPTAPFYLADAWVRGVLGSRERTAIRITASSACVYKNGLSGASEFFTLQSYTDSGGNTYYKIPLYSPTSASSGCPIDLVIINHNSARNYELENIPGKTVTVINSNDENSNVWIYSNGIRRNMPGGQALIFVCVGSFQAPDNSSAVGRGWFISGYFDNTWH